MSVGVNATEQVKQQCSKRLVSEAECGQGWENRACGQGAQVGQVAGKAVTEWAARWMLRVRECVKAHSFASAMS